MERKEGRWALGPSKVWRSGLGAGSSQGDQAEASSDVGIKPGESDFWKLVMEVFQEGRKEPLFPVLLSVESWSLDLQSEGSWRPSQEHFQWIVGDESLLRTGWRREQEVRKWRYKI